ncbi:hypothetical protein DAPPUDRAFT_307998 [Daphnia pulex]|uniref:Uncharacterized protein n=1 Tax=Daphnia pulex TaxID=6669 RepID=E9H5M2_DAPPU|nr:hypothetical protein DAPPUDRAFT_307998 [Daphnia pulex]|eukprot:EFX72888.1 hypothetical protein DAPPUDRAFT_307998 [Daphnia pulex]
MGATAEENIQNPSRTERQYSLNGGDYAIPYYGPILELPSFSYNTETRAPNYFNRPFFTAAPGMNGNGKILYQIVSIISILRTASSGERTFQTLLNLISGKPLCPACPSCPTCPVVPAACPGTTTAADPILMTINGATACTDAATGANNFGTGGCTRVTAAPTGVFTVSFTGGANAAGPYPTAFIGIVATCPNTKITVKCGTFTTAVVTTQTKAITTGGSATEAGSAMITVGRGTQAIDSVSCTWTASV